MVDISLKLYETTAFTNTKAMREKRRIDKKSVKQLRNKSGKMSRVGKTQFLKLSDREKGKYLEQFPKSSHRKLLKGDPSTKAPKEDKATKVKNDKAAKSEKRGAPEKEQKQEKLKKLTRDEFDALPKREQKAYKKQFPGKDSFKGRKHFINKKKNVVQKKKTGDMGETIKDGIPKTNDRAKNERAALKAERDEVRKDLKHGVTKEAVDALKDSTEGDLRAAGENLKNNRSANVKQIKRSLTKRPEFAIFDDKDIDRIQSTVQREAEKEDSEWTEEELKSAKKLSKTLKSGETRKLEDNDRDLLSKAGDPKALKKDPFWKKDLKVLKGFVTGERIEPEGRSNALLTLSVVARYALIAGGIAALSMGAAPAALHMAQTLFGQWDGFTANASDSPESDEDDEVDSAIELAYDAVADLLSNMEHDEFVDSINSTFLEFKSQSSSEIDLRPLVLNSDLALSVRRAAEHKVSFVGQASDLMPSLIDLVSQLGYVPTVDGMFTRGDEKLGVYQSADNTVDLLSLPSPQSFVSSILER